MKIIKYLSFFLAAALLMACEKNETKYIATEATGMAEFQIFYYAPVTSAAANNITRIDVNDQMVANAKAPLNTYNGVPSGAAARFFTVAPGSVNIKLYLKGKIAVDSLIYDQNTTLGEKKQSVFVHSFTAPPVVMDLPYPFQSNVTVQTDSTAWISFYNFLYESPNTPTTLRIQYQYLDSRTNAEVNIGGPVAFGESTGFQKVTVVKLPTDLISAGSRQISFKMKVVDANGNITGDLQIMNTAGVYGAYTGTATLNIGRRYLHTMAGFRAVRSPNASVRTFSAL